MACPSKEEIKKFLEVFEKIITFECDHRTRTGWGVWNDRAPTERLPIPEAVKVHNWLKEISED